MPNRPKNALDLLKEDHEKIEHLLDRLAGTSERGVKTREKLIEDIHRELEAHTAIEEEIFYPAVREAANDHDGEQMYFEFVEEHYLAGEVELPRAIDLDASSIEFTAHCVVLKELVMHHIEEEEARMFARARELFDEEQLLYLGRRMSERKKELVRELKKAA
ncbi:MAG TPA: hemerythrin domain-containing protein [Sandaracinaceae bacterium]